MFSKSARYYDVIYSFKDYAAEARRIRDLVAVNAERPVRTLLDVACGTGQHLARLQDYVGRVEGLDLDPQLLEVARGRVPTVPLHLGDMQTFDLGKRFDVVTCLFSSIGYVHTIEALNATLVRMAAHLEPGGVLLVEPWLTPDQFIAGTIHSLFVDEPDLKIARMNLSTVVGDLSILDFEYLIGTPEGVEHTAERHELGLFTAEQYITAFQGAGLRVRFDVEGLMGRGLYIGVL